MKINKILAFILMFVPALMLQSCLKDEDKVFEKNSANRMTEYLDNARKVLTSGNATWMMEMYPSSSQTYGGYAFTFKFDGDKVSARSELFGPDAEVTSLWNLTNDDGPVLTFDTYNEIIHFLSTPSGTSSAAGGYQAYQGEFGWIIMDVQQDVIRLRGKKTGNTIYMYRMTEDPAEYLRGCAKVDEAMIFTGLKLGQGEGAVEGIIDTDNRQVSFTSGDEAVKVAYCVTPKGIKLYKDIQMKGKTYRDFTMKYKADGNPESMDCAGDAFAATFPEGWLSYGSYLGDYTLYYYYGKNSAGEYVYETVDVTLEPDATGTKFLVKGLNPLWYVEMNYKKATGTAELCAQAVKDVNTGQPFVASNGYYIGMISWDADKGYINYGNTIGMKFKWNGEDGPIRLNLSDNGAWGTYKVSSYYLYFFKSTTLSTANRVSKIKGFNDYYVQGTYPYYQFLYPEFMVKK